MSKAQKVDETIFTYMKKQNRPYSALDIFNNLHKKIGKTAVVKSLELLSKQNKLLEKTYGKSKIYVVHQSQFSDVQDDDLNKLDVETTSIQVKLDQLNSEIQSKSKILQNLLSEPTTQDAVSQLKSLQDEYKGIMSKVESLTSSGRKEVDPEQKTKLLKVKSELNSQLRKRKRCTNDLMNAVLEGYPKSKKAFIEEVGLEID